MSMRQTACDVMPLVYSHLYFTSVGFYWERLAMRFACDHIHGSAQPAILDIINLTRSKIRNVYQSYTHASLSYTQTWIWCVLCMCIKMVCAWKYSTHIVKPGCIYGWSTTYVLFYFFHLCSPPSLSLVLPSRCLCRMWLSRQHTATNQHKINRIHIGLRCFSDFAFA